jgi:phosphatidate cytidylyltransferase
MDKLGRRMATSFVFLGLFLLILFHPTWGPHLAFVSILTVISFGLWELYDLVELKGVVVWRRCGMITGWLLAVAGYAHIMGWWARLPFETVAILFLFFSTFSFQLARGSKDSILTIMGTFFGVLYVAVPISLIFWLYKLPEGKWLILFLFLVTCLNDIGAYFVGSRWGRHSLCPKISPNKTIEGSLGGLVLGVAGVFALGWCIQAISPNDNFFWEPASLSAYSKALILAVLLSIVGQVGDLAESMLKRDVGVKDSGSSLTGHGGILDMADAIIFSVPFTFFYAKIVLAL